MVKQLLQHLHAYQPRNNDPWTGIITEQSYKPMSENGSFDTSSFNIGPTLLKWLKQNSTETLETILLADTGQALAQPYNHRIMPLVRHDEDLKTQIVWGKKYFETFFGREPNGMWLPETATNSRVCRALVDEGIQYSIGAPWQGKPLNAQNQSLDTSRPYKIDLGDGKEIIYFFYNDISGAMAYAGKNDFGESYFSNVEKDLSSLSKRVQDGEMLLLAYDEETFGHHKPFADLWQKYLSQGVKEQGDFELLTIAKYLQKFPVTEYAKLQENSSWSCRDKGIKRWSGDCACAEGHGKFKEPLLKLFEGVEDIVHDIYFNDTEKYLKDPVQARNDFIDIELGNITEAEFLFEHLKQKEYLETKAYIMSLLSAEHYAQLSMTSCGWFFPEFHLQTKENIRDAYKAIKTIESVTSQNLETDFLNGLDAVRDWKIVDGLKQDINAKDWLEEELKYNNSLQIITK